jgi:hypothetical protein
MELLLETSSNSGHGFCGMKHEHTKRFLGLSRHFTAMSTVALLVAIVADAALLPHGTNLFEVLLPMVQVSLLYAL